jgi:hypothetical protein
LGVYHNGKLRKLNRLLRGGGAGIAPWHACEEKDATMSNMPEAGAGRGGKATGAPANEENHAGAPGGPMGRRLPLVAVICRELEITPEEFAGRYRIPVDKVRDWVEGRGEPDAVAQAYLHVIARDPDMVLRALEPLPFKG